MIPSAHPGEDLLVAYAAGAAPASIELIVAAHLVFCPRCRADVAALEEVAALALLDAPPGPPAAPLPDVRLARPPQPARTPVPLPDLPALPQVVRDRIPPDAAWSGWAPGFREIALDVHEGPPARLVRIGLGVRTPKHTHAGFERTLILDGELTDDTVLRTGDLSVRGDDVVHEHLVTGDGACLCLVVNDAALVHRSPQGRLFAWLSRWIG